MLQTNKNRDPPSDASNANRFCNGAGKADLSSFFFAKPTETDKLGGRATQVTCFGQDKTVSLHMWLQNSMAAVILRLAIAV